MLLQRTSLVDTAKALPLAQQKALSAFHCYLQNLTKRKGGEFDFVNPILQRNRSNPCELMETSSNSSTDLAAATDSDSCCKVSVIVTNLKHQGD